MNRGTVFSLFLMAGLSVSACSMFDGATVTGPSAPAPEVAPTAESEWTGDTPVLGADDANAIPTVGDLAGFDGDEPPMIGASDGGSPPVVSLDGVGGGITETSGSVGIVPVESESPALAPTETESPDVPADEPTAEEDIPTVSEAAVAAPASVATDSQTRELINLGNQYYAKGDLRLARTSYTQALDGVLSAKDENDLLKVLGAINVRLFTSNASDGDLKLYTVVKGDSLSKIARDHKTTWQFLRRINGLDSNLIRIGQSLKVPKSQVALVVRRGKFVADLMVGGDFVKRYTVGTGKNTGTPLGEFTVLNRIEKPMDKDVPFGDPRHRLGTHWLGLQGANGYEGYGIHGCRPEQYKELGTECSEGCVRMTNEDAEEIHDLLPVGAKVIVKA